MANLLDLPIELLHLIVEYATEIAFGGVCRPLRAQIDRHTKIHLCLTAFYTGPTCKDPRTRGTAALQRNILRQAWFDHALLKDFHQLARRKYNREYCTPNAVVPINPDCIRITERLPFRFIEFEDDSADACALLEDLRMFGRARLGNRVKHWAADALKQAIADRRKDVIRALLSIPNLCTMEHLEHAVFVGGNSMGLASKIMADIVHHVRRTIHESSNLCDPVKAEVLSSWATAAEKEGDGRGRIMNIFIAA